MSPPDQRLFVVYLDHVAQLSGGEIALLRLLPHLDRVRAHVILAEDGPLARRLEAEGIRVEVLPMADRARTLRKGSVRGGGVSVRVALASAMYVLSLAARLRQLSPDLVHTNSLKAGVYGSLAARLAGIPVVWHVRDRIDEDYLPAPAVRLVRQMIRRLATAVVANSAATLATVGASDTGMVVYSVLPEVMAEPARRRPLGEGPLCVGVLGRLAPWKGQDLFLRAFARAFPAGDEHAIIIGDALFGENDYAASLRVLADELGIADRVEFRGHRDDVWSELARLDVLVHSSLTPEPFGQIVLEGMAAGVPVVAADAGGPAEILVRDETGLLYRMADPDALAAALLRLRDPDLREQLSANARHALGPYRPDAVAGRLQDLYDRVAVLAKRW